MIIRRRDKVLDRFRVLNPVTDFRLERSALFFTNYGEAAELGAAEGYDYQWSAYDNDGGQTEPLGPEARTKERALPTPAARPPFLMARIKTAAAGVPTWSKRVDVLVRTTGIGTLVGVEREWPLVAQDRKLVTAPAVDPTRGGGKP
jgi:hypothetical protein